MNKIEIRSFLEFVFPSAPAFSPDGSKIAFVVQTPSFDKNKYIGNIWIMERDGSGCRQLTQGGDAKSFVWSKDNTILFSASRDGGVTAPEKGASHWFEIDPRGGEAKLAFSIPLKVTKLYPVDSDRFIVTANHQNAAGGDFTDADCQVIEETPFRANGVSGFTAGRRKRLHLYRRSTGELTAITGEWFDTTGYSVRGDKLLYKGSEWRGAKDRLNYDGYWLYDPASGETRQILAPGTIRTQSFCLWDDTTALVAASDDTRYGRMQFVDFYTLDITSGCISPFVPYEAEVGSSTTGSDARLGGGFGTKLQGDRYYFLTTLGDCGYLRYIDKSGTLSPLLTPDGSADSFDVCGDDVIVCGMNGQKLPELYLNGRQVTHFNDEWLNSHSVITPEYHEFLASDGFEIHGWAMKPAGYEAGKKYPAILHIHGGPRTTFCDIFHHEMQMWANAGYFVIFCNPRGSDGRGNEFGYIQGKYGTVEYRNIMEFVDQMLAKYPDIDEGRMGVAGGSYGGFMTNWIIGHTDRFAAAVSQRSISNWVTFEHTSDIGYYFAHTHQGSTTRENAAQMWEHSPLQYAPNCTTPTLFIHSDEDFRCCEVEGVSMFTALKNSGVEAKMVLFHGENHELSRSGKPRNRIRRMEEILSWLDRHLK
ncbi:MAG: S9 family peptidase [Clostridia bacterium]|nr:S9 family peptidase [Clostridia bacterium]